MSMNTPSHDNHEKLSVHVYSFPLLSLIYFHLATFESEAAEAQPLITIQTGSCICSDWSKIHVLSECKTWKKHDIVLLFFARKPGLSNVLHCDKTLRTFKNTQVMQKITRLWLLFSTFPSCFQMMVMFYHSVINGLGFSQVIIQSLTSGASGASFEGFSPVASGVQGPLTMTFPRY